ncbi:MAG: transposase, partial [Acidobacteria bacterium]|nr:transposase [Acidobacteriota bacterium]
VASRQYERSLESTGSAIRTRGTSKSAVSRRFVAKTAAQLTAWQATALETLDLVALLVDGVHVAEHCIVVALGIDATGGKHALGLWEGSTENAAVCQSLLADLQSRGLRTDRRLLVILDGSKALHKAATLTFGPAALIHRCPVHKLRNVLEHLPDGQRASAKATMARAYRQTDVTIARRLLRDLARRLADRYPSAAASVKEGPRRHRGRAHTRHLRAPSSLARHDERDRERHRPHAPREAERETLAGRTDGRARGRGRASRSRQRLPSLARPCGYAEARGRATRARSTARPRRVRHAGRVDYESSRLSIPTASGTSPVGSIRLLGRWAASTRHRSRRCRR